MLLLGLDTATLTLSAALVERTGSGDRLVERAVVEPPTSHSTVLPGLLLDLVGTAGRKIADLAAIVVGLGPGSFTGLRISLATTKGLCYSARVPLVGGSSLGAMALAAAPDVPDGTLLVPCLDARKGEVYAGFYRRKGDAVVEESPEAALGPEALLSRLEAVPPSPSHPAVFGIGREAYPPLASLPRSTSVHTPDAFALVRRIGEIPAFDAQAVFALEPHYVRPRDSEWTLKQKKK